MEHITDGLTTGDAPAAGRVLVRDTANRDGGTLTVPADAWRAFTDGLKPA